MAVRQTSVLCDVGLTPGQFTAQQLVSHEEGSERGQPYFFL